MTRRTTAKPQTGEPRDRDRQALELAVKTYRARGKARSERIDEMIAEDGWLEAAKVAARCCQVDALHLQPWEWWPPWVVEVDEVDEPGYETRGIRQSAALLRRMLSLNISRFHPDPLAAIEAAEAKRQG